ncbi:hypothetical protein, unlikely [Trypanosoma congolense IL3000]|uniref:Uncharacterized protein n=1 Tax=Trypanosoma congolense (strain IL3000) TaxID=1068625 RepID=F9WAR0_TRYCI|nr:hypothetical protein, unlikely [Trypanosoma congolense IL3000]
MWWNHSCRLHDCQHPASDTRCACSADRCVGLGPVCVCGRLACRSWMGLGGPVRFWCLSARSMVPLCGRGEPVCCAVPRLYLNQHVMISRVSLHFHSRVFAAQALVSCLPLLCCF